MTYRQSLKNIETLLNFVTPFDCEDVFFDFSSEAEFKVIFNKDLAWNRFAKDIRTKDLAKLPYGRILKDDLGLEELIYSDQVGYWRFSIITNELLYFCPNEPLRKSTHSAQLQFAALVRKLKQE